MPKIPVRDFDKTINKARLIQGNSYDVLCRLPAESFHMSVNSPPYWPLKDYVDDEREIGHEDSLESYFDKIIPVYQELARVCRDDATLWLNIGDSYTGGEGFSLVGLPYKMVNAIQSETNWRLRQEIVWSKTNGCPDGAALNRCTRSHEFIFMFAKQPKYYYDRYSIQNDTGSNMRSVWLIATKSVKGHRATYPPDLVERCIKAGSSEKGCCTDCGKSYARYVKEIGGKQADKKFDRDRSFDWSRNGLSGSLDGEPKQYETIGWEATCSCEAPVIPCRVLDPFAGACTTALVANRLGRDSLGIDLSRESLEKVGVPRLLKG